MTTTFAQMHPCEEEIKRKCKEKETPFAEVSVYEWLKRLPPDCHVFHSVKTMRKVQAGFVTNFENDFVIVHPKYGVVVLEVKGGLISTDADGNLVQTNSETYQKQVLSGRKDPLSQAMDAINNVYMDLFNDSLGKRKPYICPAVFFTAMTRSEFGTFQFPIAYQTLKKCGGILVRESLNEDPDKTIHAILEAQGGNRCAPMTKDELNKVLEIIAGSMNMVGLPFERTGELDYRFEMLTEEQASLLDYIQEQKLATIQGAAGTGKTILANLAAERLAAKGDRVLYVCFNSFLAEELAFCHPQNGVVYKTIKALAAESKGPFDDLNTPGGRANALYNRYPADYSFDDVIVDEAQDLCSDEVDFLKDVAVQHKGTCYIFYDKNQILYDIDSADWIAKAECRLVLSRNCRNPKLIGQSSNSVLNQRVDTILMDTEGDQPRIIIEKDPTNFKLSLYHIIQDLKSEKHGLKNEDIVILTLKTEDSSFLEKEDSLFGIRISSKKEPGSIWFTTARKFKGLERKGVIIIDIDEQAFCTDKMGSNQDFYVACSRATHCLRMLVVGGEEKLQKIGNAIEGNPMMKPEGKIRSKTKTKPF